MKEQKRYPTIATARCMGPSILTRHEKSYHGLYKRGVSREIESDDVPVYMGRNECSAMYLKAMAPEDYIIFIDTDMWMPPNMLLRLTAHGLPVVSGLYYEDRPPYWPLMFRLKSRLLRVDTVHGETGHYDMIDDWKDGELREVDACGMGCTAIRRDVMEKIPFPQFSFEQGTEDFFFCRKVQLAGFKIHVDTSVKCGHLKVETIGEVHFRAWKEARRMGLKEPPPESHVTVMYREFIGDKDIIEQPLKEMALVERSWTPDTTR